ncbi:MAG: methyltransferase domain-containing protein [Candidatus Micrarchaeota archaeon]
MEQNPIQKSRTRGFMLNGGFGKKTRQVEEFYNKFFGRNYDRHMRKTGHYRVMDAFLDLAVNRIPGAPAKILDPACGTGHAIRHLLSKRQDLSFVANDLSSTMLSIAKHKLNGYAPEKIEFTQHDVHNLPIPNGTFTAILLGYGMHWFVDKAGAVDELYRVLEDHGRLISIEEWPLLVTPTKYSAKFGEKLVETVTPINMEEMSSVFHKAGFTTIECEVSPIDSKHDMHYRLYAKR